MADVVPVPSRFKDGIEEAEIQNVLRRLFPKVMVNSVNLLLVEDRMDHVVQFESAF
jgi:hypothetical protein